MRMFVLVAGFALLMPAAYAQQSLGEAARQARKRKPAPSPAQRVYTNENLPTNAPLTVMSGAGSDNSPQGSKSKDSATESGEKSKDASSADDKKAQEDWQVKIAEQKEKVQLLERELGILERESQIRSAVFYADAGTRLRDDRKFADAERKNKADMESKQKELEGAKQRLEDLREEARKAGMPASVRD
jgi:hypothetical protein